jgi:hypothetical protein
MNLLIAFHTILQDEETLGQEEVEDAGREEDLQVAGQEESSNGGEEDSEEEDDNKEVEEGQEEDKKEEGAGQDDEGWVTGLLQDPHPQTDLGAACLHTNQNKKPETPIQNRENHTILFSKSDPLVLLGPMAIRGTAGT